MKAAIKSIRGGGAQGEAAALLVCCVKTQQKLVPFKMYIIVPNLYLASLYIYRLQMLVTVPGNAECLA